VFVRDFIIKLLALFSSSSSEENYDKDMYKYLKKNRRRTFENSENDHLKVGEWDFGSLSSQYDRRRIRERE
jgi:hypothetical protein